MTVGGWTDGHLTRLWLAKRQGRQVPPLAPKLTSGGRKITRPAASAPVGSAGVIAAGRTSQPVQLLLTCGLRLLQLTPTWPVPDPGSHGGPLLTEDCTT